MARNLRLLTIRARRTASIGKDVLKICARGGYAFHATMIDRPGIASAINAGEMSRPGWKANGRFHRPQGLGKWLR
ncbi:hypothetical protein [Raoultella ornithinolytica]|uniref:hypothetical protein n=1 Tax=Raoultella ornithinolytica TaxID=54291 RepID=UPI0013985878|nr:hypothetical protein [Raoultella ornithinolytica]QHW68782.1 hypothetical protein GZS10_13565 [Raoultella ornithinolytica]